MPVEAEHECVAGPSGGGKTTLLREKHDKFNGISVFLTVKSNERKAVSDPPARIRKSSCSYPEDIKQTRQWALQRDEQVQIIVDECQNVPTFRDGSDGPVRKMLHEDRSRGIKCVVSTQNPQDLRTNEWNYGPLQQCKWFVWVGPGKTWHRGFRNWLNLESEQLPDVNFRYHVINPADPPEVVYEGRTSKRYG